VSQITISIVIDKNNKAKKGE